MVGFATSTPAIQFSNETYFVSASVLKSVGDFAEDSVVRKTSSKSRESGICLTGRRADEGETDARPHMKIRL
jgi:hypothetical protein